MTPIVPLSVWRAVSFCRWGRRDDSFSLAKAANPSGFVALASQLPQRGSLDRGHDGGLDGSLDGEPRQGLDGEPGLPRGEERNASNPARGDAKT